MDVTFQNNIAYKLSNISTPANIPSINRQLVLHAFLLLAIPFRLVTYSDGS